MTYYAHSPKKDRGIAAQTYADHIGGVLERAAEHADAASRYAAQDGATLCEVVKQAAEFHDLGKLDKENQLVLSGAEKARSLPKNHVDAGAAYFLHQQHLSPIASVLIQGHHIGLADFVTESTRGADAFRDANIKAETDAALQDYADIHKSLFPTQKSSTAAGSIKSDMAAFLRIALSCLADADHENTAVHAKNATLGHEQIPLLPKERSAVLDDYVTALKGDDSERTLLRQQMYHACCTAQVEGNIASCDGPVGIGKTTAIMAHLLKTAARLGLRRIFVILPFTNIITQSVKVYRKALTLPGENPKDVVAELHHRADFESNDARHLTALWRAPIIVTTAVAFFETLASNSPAALRRLHELPGSAIFVDESHAAMPTHLLPLSWRWINVYAQNWGCYWLLASGSLNRFWEIAEIAGDHQHPVPEIVPQDLRSKLSLHEKQRITYQGDLAPKSIAELANWVRECPGPQLVILNTVQNAAVLAQYINCNFGREHVEHLSSALTPHDREKTLERIKQRLKDKQDSNWLLVATSCVEAGVDFSFKTGFRELSSTVSLLQTAGRVNREALDENAEIHSFCLAKNALLNENPGIQTAAEVLRSYYNRGIAITPALSTKSLDDEIKLSGMPEKYKELVNHEKRQSFPIVEDKFRMIESYTAIAVVDNELAEQIRYGKIDWRQLQLHSVQIPKYKLTEMRAQEIVQDIYHWNMGYDSFIGYMAGIVQLKELEQNSMVLTDQAAKKQK